MIGKKHRHISVKLQEESKKVWTSIFGTLGFLLLLLLLINKDIQGGLEGIYTLYTATDQRLNTKNTRTAKRKWCDKSGVKVAYENTRRNEKLDEEKQNGNRRKKEGKKR